MATIVELPRLSDTMEEGVITKWRVSVGDKVKRGQVIADIETDKATMEFESFDAGVVLKLVAVEGETLPLGATIAVLGKPGEDPETALENVAGNGTSATVASKQAHSEATPLEPKREPTTLTSVSTGDRDVAKASAAVPVHDESGETHVPASPLARKLARENDIPLERIRGTGPHGRVVKNDVEAAISKGITSSRTVVDASFAANVDEYGRPFVARPDSVLKLTQMRKTIAKRMVQSKPGIPHWTLTVDLDMERAAKLRAEYNEVVSGTKVSYNDIVVFAVARALRQHPLVNGYFDDDHIVLKGDVHVGVAIAVEHGLIVVPVRYADQKTLKAISIEVRDLGKRAKDKALHPEEMTGSTFTISNLGMFGIEDFAAVINPGEAGILAVGSVEERVVVVDGQMVIRKRMKITLAGDHRVIDGIDGAKFLVTLKKLIEQPLGLFT